MRQQRLAVDWTKYPENKKLKKFYGICPNCGKVGKITRYTDGSGTAYKHKGHFEVMAIIIDEMCMIPTES